MSSTKVNHYAVLFLAILLVFSCSVVLVGDDLDGDQILEKTGDNTFTAGGKKDLVINLSLTVHTTEGRVKNYKFKLFTKDTTESTALLLSYLQPRDVKGTLLLSKQEEGKDSRIWNYLPALSITKEVKASGNNEQKFANSNLTKEEISKGLSLSEDYNAQVIEEQTINIDGEELPSYVLSLKPSSEDTNWRSIKAWVQKEEFVTLKALFYNEKEKAERVLQVSDLRKDRVGYLGHKIVVKNRLNSSKTEIEILNRQEKQLPADYFNPEKLDELELEN
ncbi:outer membrane lipoprotein-sorting protein [Candidatus Bipolaricaulota bacterium]|nr:outer membrane lipoprotein-sorting protein [Candidatus Bipolaricaulota bacterium]